MKKSILIIIFAFCFLACIGGICIAFSNNNNNNTPNTAPVEIIKELSSCSYCAYGDSITYGFSNGSQMQNPYSKLVAENLGLKSYVNKGVSGTTYTTGNAGRGCLTTNILNDTNKYDIISVLGGVNDYYANAQLGTIDDNSNNTIYGSLKMCVSYLKRNNPNSFIFIMTPYKCLYENKQPCTTNNASGYNLRDVANAVKDVAKLYNIPCLDLYETGNFESEMTQSYSDGVHPTQNFISNYTAPQIAQFIKDNYNKG